MNEDKRPIPKRTISKSKLRLDVTATAGHRYVPFLRRNLRRAHGLLGTSRAARNPPSDVSLALVGDRRMAALHEQFLGIAGPTDVLTFPFDANDVDDDGAASGEIVVCVPEAIRRSRTHGTGVERELLLYALHGVLHLCGMDDRTEPGFRIMHRTEDEILTRLGIGPVFARQSSRNPASTRARSGGAQRKSPAARAGR